MKRKNIFQKNFSLKSGIVIILISSAFIMFLIAAFVASPKREKAPRAVISPVTTATTSTPTRLQTSKSTDMRNWPVYTNDEYGFSFAHPPGTEVIRQIEGNGHSVDGFLVYDEQGFDLPVWIYERKCSRKCFQDEIVDWMPKTRLDGKEVAINGQEGYEINFDDDGKVRREIYFRDRNANVLYFEFRNLQSLTEPLPPVKQNILDSFRFDL